MRRNAYITHIYRLSIAKNRKTKGVLDGHYPPKIIKGISFSLFWQNIENLNLTT